MENQDDQVKQPNQANQSNQVIVNPRFNPSSLYKINHYLLPSTVNKSTSIKPWALNPKAYPNYFSPNDLRNIYNIPVSSYNKTTSPRQVTIVITIAYHYNNLIPDFNVWWKNYYPSIPTPTINQYYIGSTPSNTSNYYSVNSGWGVEECLDVQMVAAANPNANICVVEAENPNELIYAIYYATNTLNADVVSCSWGGSDFSSLTISQMNKIFFANPNTTYCVSSGDSHSVSWPAVLSNVIAVGGTNVKCSLPFSSNRSSTNCTETNWNSAGCGYSVTIPIPSYQNVAGVNSNKYRSIPDISLVGDPATGVNTYCSSSTPRQQSGWNVYGGTSVACPIFAGILSLAIQTRINNKKNPLTTVWNGGTATSDKYNIQNYLYKTIYLDKSASTSVPNSYSNCLYDIKTGTKNIAYLPSIGYDIATGLGSVNAANLCAALANIP